MSSNAEVAALREEIVALRALVGPSDDDYRKLQRDVLNARDAAKGAEAELGTLRGTIVEMTAQLARARQDQDAAQRGVLLARRKALGVVARARRIFS